MVYVPNTVHSTLQQRYGLGPASVDVFAGYVVDHPDDEALSYIREGTEQRLSEEQAREVLSLLRRVE